ncbi:translocation/assembly module TamB domain-containing protein [Palleronia caenipelagi]|uniref:Translocation and assembly module TamB C-terminal domain-containing protein n=1 Tax=Palleronia caenipelagi TaxID=2489174 RepID=A0A547Q5R8_9RHOB|nr:translocation/assembly module TamB domain-containing protein [Palleronia caenipelagi]TRD21687.1 hypothetical protein FEV53_08070 [Palleronia caenipelagi]
MNKLARIALIGTALGVLPVLAQDSGEDEGGFLERLIEDKLSSDEMTVRVRGLDGALSSKATIDQIEISDPKGVWLTINNAELDWRRTALLRGRLDITSLSAGEILLPRLPEAKPKTEMPNVEAEPFSLPDLPVAIEIDEIEAARVALGAPVAKQDVELSLSGAARLVDGDGAVQITSERIDGKGGSFNVDVSYESASRDLSVDVALNEPAGGWIGTILNLPGNPSLNVEIAGEGPLSDFTATLDLDTDGTPRLDGQVALKDVDGASTFAVDLGGDVTALFLPSYRPFFGDNIQLKANGQRGPDGSVRLDQLDLEAEAMTLAGEVVIGADRVPDLIDITGRIAADDGPVLLPVGTNLRVNELTLDVQYDTTKGEDWTGLIEINGFDQPDLGIDRIALDGSGIIANTANALAVTAGFDFDAEGLSLADGGLEDALGNSLTGRIDLDYETGAPVTLSTLRLKGAGFDLDGTGGLDPDGDGLPVSFTGQVSAADLSIFTALAGRPLSGAARLSLDASARVLARTFDVTLSGQTGDLTINIPKLDPLLGGDSDLALSAWRDETGLVVPVLRFDNAAVTLDGAADLTSEGGTASLDLRIDDLGRVDEALTGPAIATLSANRPEDVWDIVLRANAAGTAIRGEANLSELDEDSPLARFDLTATAEDLGRFSGIAGRDLGGTFDIEAKGGARLNLQSIDATLTGSLNNLALGQRELDRLLTGQTALDAEVFRAGGVIRVPELSLENPQIEVTGTADVRPGDSTAKARVLLADLSKIVPDMTGPARLTLDAREDGKGWVIDLDGDGAGARIVADATVTELDAVPLFDGTARISADRLSAFDDLARRPLGGSFDVSFDGQARADLSRAEAEISGTATDIAIGQAQIDRLLGGRTDIALSADKSGDRINARQVRITNPQVTLTGDGQYGGETPGQAGANITFAELSQIVPAMSGPAEITLTAEEQDKDWQIVLDGDGAGSAIRAEVAVSDLDTTPLVNGSGTLSVADLSVYSELAKRDLGGAVDVRFDGRARTDLSRAGVDLSGTLQSLRIDQPEADRLLRGATTLALKATKSEDVHRVTELTLNNAQITLDGNGSYGGGDPGAVELTARMPELGAVLPEMRGPANLRLVAEETGRDWQLSLDADGAGSTVDVLGQVSDLTRRPSFDGRASLRSADLSRFNRIARRSLAGSLNADVVGLLRFDASRFDVTADVTGQGLRVGIPQADKLLAGGATELRVDAARDAASAPIRVRSFRLDSPGLDATASGTVLGGGANLTLDARLADLGQFVPKLSGPLSAAGRVRQSGQTINLDLGLQGPEGITAQIGGSVAQNFARAGLTATGTAPLRLVNPFLGNRSLAGDARYDLRLNGPLDLDALAGTVQLADVRYVDPKLSLVLNDISGSGQISGGRITVDLTANKQEGGRLRASGPIGLTSPFNAGLSLNADELVFEDPRLYRTTLTGNLQVDGPLRGGARIGGALTLGETNLRVPSTGLGVTGPIPEGMVHVGEPADVRRTREYAGIIKREERAARGGGPVYPLDITLSAPNRVFIRGRGLDAEMGGDLTIGGTTRNVVPSGQFSLIRGRLDILGQRITMDEGSVTLQGDFIPVIRLVARTETDDVTIRVDVDGVATEPEISFGSEPELPEDEVLARLLFGKSISNISALQAAQLASAVATLAGKGGEGVISKLRGKTGLDDLDVTTDSEGNVGVTAGKYVAENVYTDVSVGASGEAEASINLDLTPDITVRGSAANDGEAKLGIFFERDY